MKGALLAASAGLALALLGWRMRSGTLGFLRRHGLIAVNYAGAVIPVGSGALLALLGGAFYAMAELAAVWLKVGDGAITSIREQGTALLLVFAAGWTDDLIGERHVKGLRGHWRDWTEKRTPSTGLVKAAAIAAAALWVVSRQSVGLLEAAADWLTVVLASNGLNLLDVRPGRAWKGFALGSLLVVAAGPDWTQCGWLLPAAAGGAALIAGDLKGEHMLGDCGSNWLGFTLGSMLAFASPAWVQAIGIGMFLAMHRLAEGGSVTAWIERHKWVDWLDRLGRLPPRAGK